MDTCTRFEDKINSCLNSCPADAPLLLAVSGGADSMAMLTVLHAIAGERKIFCLHVEHGIRPANESCGDAEFVRTFCNKNGIECNVISIPQGKVAVFAQRWGIGIEAAARHYRHKALSREATRLGEKTLILLGHTKDDLLELALMRILRGVGPCGLAAMPQKRGRLFRPLLDMTRCDILNYLNAKNVSWREDSTNDDTRFLRNQIRQQLIPFLNESFSSWKTGVESMAQTQSLAAGFIADEARTRINWQKNLPRTNIHPAPSFGAGQDQHEQFFYFTEEEIFFAQALIIREEAVFQAINAIFLREKNHNKSIKRAVVRKFCSGAVKAADLGVVRIKREKGMVLLSMIKDEFFETGISRLIRKRV